ncbi:hypothetical protein [Actinoplanes sp. G11-F43]|uniref:hypothetical protein n=1 Tax=Actinoplanes sp. G11-F43 TaxID=3424130 RepID=UPI003D33B932
MEILPGKGVVTVRVGEPRELVESRLGAPVHAGRDSRVVYETSPTLVVDYTEDELVEVVQVAYSGDGGEEAFFDGVQLTWRFMEDVVADLAAKDYRYEADGSGYRFEVGFTIFDTGARSPRDLDPGAADDDDRGICEGVAIAPYEYLSADSDHGEVLDD